VQGPSRGRGQSRVRGGGVRARAIAKLTKVDAMSELVVLNFTALDGKQKPESFEGLPTDVLTFTTSAGSEQAGLVWKATSTTHEEELEIKTFPRGMLTAP
jgi:hypothetical protein